MNKPVLSSLVSSEAAAEYSFLSSLDSGHRKGSPFNATLKVVMKFKTRFKDVINRTIFSIVMAYTFLACISVGILFGIPLLLTISVVMFYEISRINRDIRKERQLPSVQALKWYFLIVSIVYITLHNLRDPLLYTCSSLLPLYSKLPFIGFSLLMVGVIGFVLSLRKGMYRYQFTQFTWATMTLMFIVSQCAGEMKNMMRGMVWFLLPVSCVINNDIWAYVFGKLFGRTRLLALSPKKTLEGFVGSFLFTVIWSYWFCGFLSYFPEMYCPVVGFSNTVNSQCTKNMLFVQKEVALPQYVQHLTLNYWRSINVSPAQGHAIVLGIFASLLAPFGGFFASGLKRAFKIKDFGDLIPGHGGMTDRMDCQGIMGLFTYFYLKAYVFNEPKCLSSLSDVVHCALSMDAVSRRVLLSELQHSFQN